MLETCARLLNMMQHSKRTRVLALIALTGFVLFALLFTKLLMVLLAFGMSVSIIIFKSKRQIPFDFTPTFFLAILFTQLFGFWYGALYAGLTFVFALLFGEPDPLTVLYGGELLGLLAVSTLFSGLGLVMIGVVMSSIEFVASSLLNLVLGRQAHEFVGTSLFSLGFNLALFLGLTKVVVPVLMLAI